MVSGSASAVEGLRHVRTADADIVVVTLTDGRRAVLAIADDVTASKRHSASIDGRTIVWTGHIGRADWEKTR